MHVHQTVLYGRPGLPKRAGARSLPARSPRQRNLERPLSDTGPYAVQWAPGAAAAARGTSAQFSMRSNSPSLAPCRNAAISALV
jgi:hypothetical protein